MKRHCKPKLCVEILGSNDKDLPQVQPVFISIDPERDTPAKLKEYLADFHPRLIGLTGTSEMVKKAAKSYRVYYSRPYDDNEDYLVDHTIIMYLVRPDGSFAQYYGQNKTVEEVVQGIKEHLKKSN
eukprot:m.262693 g.262693  ORF g.262693 m.262693 type:complete len:126 (+) comp16223_c0_seq13:1681-2058(+)